MRRIRLIISYDGTGYVGWQTQLNGISVQQKIEEAIFNVTGQASALHGSGRTDSGVHARAQVAHFDTDVRMPADKFSFAINTFLPPDIRVLYSEETDESFHARFSAKNKQYRYSIHLGPHDDVFTRNTALHLHRIPDMDLLVSSAALVTGTHDFRAFMSPGSSVKSTVRTVSLSEWTKEGCMLRYDVAGNGFLYNMVRILVGTMLDIAEHRIPECALKDALASGDRLTAGSTAPAHGLMLYRVTYDDFDTETVLKQYE